MPEPRGPRQNPVNDIDRFLMEVDRLRRKASNDARRVQPRRDDEVIPVDEVLPADDAPPVRRAPRPRPRPRRFDDVEVVDAVPAQTDTRGFTSAPADQRGFTASPQAGSSSSGGTVATVATIARPAAIATVAAPQAAGRFSRLAVNPAAEQVRTLLKPANIRAAVLLREILDPPLCLRRRRR